MEHNRINGLSLYLAAALLATACGGGGGSGGGGNNNDPDNDPGGTGPGSSSARLQIIEASSSGLLAHNPASPGGTTVLDADADFSNVNTIPVLGATWNNGQTDDGYVEEVVYQNASNHLMRVSTDGSGGVTPSPQRVSDNIYAACRLDIGQDFADIGNSRIAFQRCDNDEWWWTILRRDETGKIVEFPGTPIVDLIDPADGSHDGWLVLDQGSIRYMDDQGTSASVIGTPSSITEATHLESIQDGHVLLNIDGELWTYRPGSGLTDLGHAFTFGSGAVSTCAIGPSTCPALHVVDDSELFFIDEDSTEGNDRLYRTDLAQDRVIELDANPQPPQFTLGGRRLAVGTDRVVWSYEADPTPNEVDSGDEETVLRTLNKDTGSGSDLDRVPQLDLVVSAPNQPFLDRTGDWFFYTWSNGMDTQPTAVAARMDKSSTETYAGAAWQGVSTNLISFADLDNSLKRIYLVDGLSSTNNFADKNLKSISPASPGVPTTLGTTPSDTQGFSLMGGFGLDRLAFLTADDGGSGSQQDVLYLNADTAGSLQRVTNTTNEDENPSSFF